MNFGYNLGTFLWKCWSDFDSKKAKADALLMNAGSVKISYVGVNVALKDASKDIEESKKNLVL